MVRQKNQQQPGRRASIASSVRNKSRVSRRSSSARVGHPPRPVAVVAVAKRLAAALALPPVRGNLGVCRAEAFPRQVKSLGDSGNAINQQLRA